MTYSIIYKAGEYGPYEETFNTEKEFMARLIRLLLANYTVLNCR